MGGLYYWECTYCTNEIKLHVGFEFYRDAKGQLRPYGHPTPISADAKYFGIKGYYSELYCPKCRKIKNVIVLEYEEPNGWDKRIIDIEDEDKHCIVCGSILLEKPEDLNECPNCNTGHFFLSGTGIS
jgi:hypothetical protein